MKIGQATFTATNGCLVDIDGWRADIETKLTMLQQGVCNVSAESFEDSPKAGALMDVGCGDDGMTPGCDNIQLVELALRYFDWVNNSANAPWADTVMAGLPASEAMQEFVARLAKFTEEVSA